jgi:putative membrane protein
MTGDFMAGACGSAGSSDLLLLLQLSVIIVKAVDRSGGSRNTSAGKSALDILKERYASGEIDKEEFEKRKKDLM